MTTKRILTLRLALVSDESFDVRNVGVYSRIYRGKSICALCFENNIYGSELTLF